MTSHYDKYCEAISNFDAEAAAIHYVNWQAGNYNSPEQKVQWAKNKILWMEECMDNGEWYNAWMQVLEDCCDCIEENTGKVEQPDHLDPAKVAAAVQKHMEHEKKQQAATKLLWTYKPGEPVIVQGHNVADGESGNLWKFYEVQLDIETEEQFDALTAQLKKDPDFDLLGLREHLEISIESFEAHWSKDSWEPDGHYLYGTWDLGKL